MKRHILPVFLTVLSIVGCNLDIPHENEIGGFDAINTLQRAQDALNAVFGIYPKDKIIEFSLLSEDFTPTHLMNTASQGEDKLYLWNAQEISFLSDHLWTNYYSLIAQVNNLLASEPHIILNNNEERDMWHLIKANALGMKALAYHELLALFSPPYAPNNAGIVLKNNVKYEKSNRSDSRVCLEEIEHLLEEAASLTDSAEENIQPCYYLNTRAITLLQSRAALYAGKYEEAAAFAEKLLSKAGYKDYAPDVNAFENLWISDKSHKSEERIFLFDNHSYLLQQYDLNEKGDMIAVSSAFDYEPNDLRHNRASIPSIISDYQGNPLSVCLVGKHRKALNDKSPMPVHWLRLAEAYFILAECRMIQGREEEARNTVNIVLEKRNASVIPGDVRGETLHERIQMEKQKEFVGEGINFFDLKRWKKEIRRFGSNSSQPVSIIKKDDYRRTFPIPYAELTQNEAMTQNSGWTGLIY